ncbi:hypothetical protein [Pedobacter sp. CFBP9032]|uniref:hypothetical protein n=1 Tax=Pedobacter sp. CFBP9032 TaxID=3096539 RepID=UPI002A6A9565|nr:hypothetical protein [Pedobacter sp. CFBP9032]MDY0905620.1 hypothetical protein [Pedobacter sp. CFBP9032]
MNNDAKLMLIYSTLNIPYFSLQFDDYELPLFGNGFFNGDLNIPSKGQVCSPKISGQGWSIVGDFEKVDLNYDIFIYQLGFFIAEPNDTKNNFSVKLQPEPTDKLKLLGFKTKMQKIIPRDSELWRFLTENKKYGFWS